MKPSIVAKLEALYERHEEVQALLGDAATIADQDRFRALSREYAQLSDVARCYTEWRQVQDDIETAQMMLDDAEMREMAQEELRDAKAKSEEMEQQLQVLLLPKDPDDERNAFVEVRAGTGADFDKGVAFIIRILRQQQHLQLLLHLLAFRFRVAQFFLRHFAHFRIVEHHLCSFDIVLHLAPFGIAARHVAQLCIFPRQRAESILIGDGRSITQQRLNFLMAFVQSFQFGNNRRLHRREFTLS